MASHEPHITVTDQRTHHAAESHGKEKSFSQAVFSMPLTLLGVVATCGALGYGLYAMSKGDQRLSTKMMGWRVRFQALTIVSLLGYVWYSDAFASLKPSRQTTNESK